MTHLAHPVLPATALCLDTADNPPRRPGSPFRLVSVASPECMRRVDSGLGPSTCQRCNALHDTSKRQREALEEARANLPPPTPLNPMRRHKLLVAAGYPLRRPLT